MEISRRGQKEPNPALWSLDTFRRPRAGHVGRGTRLGCSQPRRGRTAQPRVRNPGYTCGCPPVSLKGSTRLRLYPECKPEAGRLLSWADVRQPSQAGHPATPREDRMLVRAGLVQPFQGWGGWGLPTPRVRHRGLCCSTPSGSTSAPEALSSCAWKGVQRSTWLPSGRLEITVERWTWSFEPRTYSSARRNGYIDTA